MDRFDPGGAAPAAERSPCTPDEARHLGAFVAELERRGRAPKTIDSYRSDWSGFVDWYAQDGPGAPFEVSALDDETVAAYREHLRTSGLRPATINRKLVFLKRYASWAQGRGLLRARATESIREVAPVPQKPRRPKGLSDLELRRFLREVDRRAPARDQAIVHTLLETGLRVSELVALERDDVNLGSRAATVTPDDLRSLPLSGHGRRRLRAWLSERGDAPGPLFLGERGPLTANAVQRVVRKYCRFAKVQASPGTLRHTFAAAFLAAHGGDLVALADLLGHESLETTRLYLCADGEDAPPPRAYGRERARPVVVPGGVA
jgi:site-specific recombinase XerD